MEDIEKTQELAAKLQSYALQAAYGAAMLKANRLEFCLRTLLIMQLNAKSDDELYKALSELQRLPLGRLIERVIQAFSIPDYWQEELDNLRWFRNQLAHQIMDDISWNHLLEEDEWELISYLNQVGSFYEETIDYVTAMIAAEQKKRSLTKEDQLKFDELFSRYIQRLKQGKMASRE